MTRSTTHYRSHYIKGQWLRAFSMDVLPVHDSSTEGLMSTVPSYNPKEAEAAVLAAPAAFPSWTALQMRQAIYVDKTAHGLKKTMDELASVIRGNLACR